MQPFSIQFLSISDLSHSLGVFGIMLGISDSPGAWVTKCLEEFALGSLGLFVMDQRT